MTKKTAIYTEDLRRKIYAISTAVKETELDALEEALFQVEAALNKPLVELWNRLHMEINRKYPELKAAIILEDTDDVDEDADNRDHYDVII